jgi:hypothetical protein
MGKDVKEVEEMEEVKEAEEVEEVKEADEVEVVEEEAVGYTLTVCGSGRRRSERDCAHRTVGGVDDVAGGERGVVCAGACAADECGGISEEVGEGGRKAAEEF